MLGGGDPLHLQRVSRLPVPGCFATSLWPQRCSERFVFSTSAHRTMCLLQVPQCQQQTIHKAPNQGGPDCQVAHADGVPLFFPRKSAQSVNQLRAPDGGSPPHVCLWMARHPLRFHHDHVGTCSTRRNLLRITPALSRTRQKHVQKCTPHHKAQLHTHSSVRHAACWAAAQTHQWLASLVPSTCSYVCVCLRGDDGFM
mgnify:CR=1 FL=1